MTSRCDPRYYGAWGCVGKGPFGSVDALLMPDSSGVQMFQIRDTRTGCKYGRPGKWNANTALITKEIDVAADGVAVVQGHMTHRVDQHMVGSAAGDMTDTSWNAPSRLQLFLDGSKASETISYRDKYGKSYWVDAIVMYMGNIGARGAPVVAARREGRREGVGAHACVALSAN